MSRTYRRKNFEIEFPMADLYRHKLHFGGKSKINGFYTLRFRLSEFKFRPDKKLEKQLFNFIHSDKNVNRNNCQLKSNRSRSKADTNSANRNKIKQQLYKFKLDSDFEIINLDLKDLNKCVYFYD